MPEIVQNNQRQFLGKYRGKIVENKDPLSLGRIRAKVPGITSPEKTGWVLPCVPYAGDGVGFFFIPPIDANVWIEFERGNTDSPIWSGCFWGAGEAPELPAVPDVKIIKTDFAKISINDAPGSGKITIETKDGAKIELSSSGIEIKNGSQNVKLTSANVTINDGTLEVS